MIYAWVVNGRKSREIVLLYWFQLIDRELVTPVTVTWYFVVLEREKERETGILLLVRWSMKNANSSLTWMFYYSADPWLGSVKISIRVYIDMQYLVQAEKFCVKLPVIYFEWMEEGGGIHFSLRGFMFKFWSHNLAVGVWQRKLNENAWKYWICVSA